MNAAARAVDNEGVCAVADAAKRANVKRVVLISSILTNGPGFGAQDTAGYKITNAFGRVLEEKLVGENHLRASGVPWTIVRPAGLKTDAPKNPLVVAGRRRDDERRDKPRARRARDGGGGVRRASRG